MSHIAVIADSCTSLPDSYFAEYQIASVPYYVHLGTEQYRDNIDITRDEFLEQMRNGVVPKSANPGPADYAVKLRAAAERTKEMIVYCMTSLGSGAYQAALLAREMVSAEISGLRIEVVDTRNVSMGHGWMALEGARKALAGASMEQLLALAQRMIPVTRMLQTADTLRYLYLGGRIGKAKHLVGSVLNLKPIISMEDGVIVALGQARGRPAAYRKMMSLIAEKVGAGGRIKSAIVHAADPEAAGTLREMVESSFACVESITTNLSSALATHTGPGTVGVCYFPASVVEG